MQFLLTIEMKGEGNSIVYFEELYASGLCLGVLKLLLSILLNKATMDKHFH